MNCNEANSIPIDMFLASLGLEPVRTRDRAKWYRSPLRDEKTASFKVDTRINKWYDFGTGTGGDLVSLGTRLSNLTVTDFLSQMSTHKLAIVVNMARPIEEPVVSESRINDVRQITHPALINYLKYRCIPLTLANTFCSEVHYSNNEQKYFALGIKNDSDGYEVRNSAFKGSVGKKDITTIKRASDEVCMFEGFIDFLSAHRIFKNVPTSSIIILNSVTQLDKGINALKTFEPNRIEAYLNNDDAGKRSMLSLREKFPLAINCTPLFHPFNDVNDFLKSEKNQNISR
jgi:hypothetical protein